MFSPSGALTGRMVKVGLVELKPENKNTETVLLRLTG